MFGKKKLEKEISSLKVLVDDLKSIIQDLCPHETVKLHTRSWWDGSEDYRISCEKCNKTISNPNYSKAMKIMKEQEIKKAKELIAKSEQEEKEKTNE